MDDIEETGTVETVGQRLRLAREAQGLTLEAIAAQTRIPTRHLASLEASEWDALPAPTYSVGFAKNYAAVVGLDKAEIANQLREEMGGTRVTYAQAEVFQPADPKRSMPKWLIIGAVVALVVVFAVLSLLRSRDLSPGTTVPATAEAPVAATAAVGTQAPLSAATGQVTLTALQPVWFEVRDEGGAILKQGQMDPPATFDVPATATAPRLKTGRPEALRITVGGRDVPAVGVAGKSVANVSLLAADLSRGPSAATTPSPDPVGVPSNGAAPAGQ